MRCKRIADIFVIHHRETSLRACRHIFIEEYARHSPHIHSEVKFHAGIQAITFGCAVYEHIDTHEAIVTRRREQAGEFCRQLLFYIGKNIVRTVLENYGYTVLDLGRDVPAEQIVETVRREEVPLVGLSALMTTTLPAMAETIRALREAGLPCRVMVGGAVLTPEYARDIGADFYARDAKQAADIARQVFES